MSLSVDEWKTMISMVSHIYSETFNLDFQFKNIFTAAMIEAGQVSPEICKVDIQIFLFNLIQSFKYEARKKNIKVLLHGNIKGYDNAFFKTDPEKLKLILSNLLSNAIKFSNKNSKIDINYSLEKDNLKVSIQDYGKGISKENQKIIFDRFQRADNGINSLNRGHGLGLSINKALIEILNGTIDIQTTLKKGTTFTITLPQEDVDVTGVSANDNEVIFGGDEDVCVF